jgi:hypothetical protein
MLPLKLVVISSKAAIAASFAVTSRIATLLARFKGRGENRQQVLPDSVHITRSPRYAIEDDQFHFTVGRGLGSVCVVEIPCRDRQDIWGGSYKRSLERQPKGRVVDARWLRSYKVLDPTTCQYRLEIPHSAGRKVCHPPEIKVYSFSRLIENGAGW